MTHTAPRWTAAALALLAAAAVSRPLPSAAEPPASCDEPVATHVERIVTKGSRDAYRCLATMPEAGPALLDRIEADGFAETDGHERVTRALAVHLIHQLDRPLTGREVRALAPSDRRLLRDAVYARRGRRSPSPEHDTVFQQFAWYQPQPGFNNGALSAGDRANIALIDDPPPPPEPEAPPSAAEAVAETAAASPPAAPGASEGCGCAAGHRGAPATGAALLLVGLGLVRRRG